MANALMITGSGTSVTTGVTAVYFLLGNGPILNNTTTSKVEVTWHTPGTLRNLYARSVTKTGAGDTVFRTRRNAAVAADAASAANGWQVITVSGAQTGDFEDAVNTDAVVDGDEYKYSAVADSTGSLTCNVMSSLFGADTDTVVRHIAAGSLLIANGGNTWSFRPGERMGGQTISTGYQVNAAGTIQDLFVTCSYDGQAGNTTVQVEVATVATSLSVTVTGTGVFESSASAAVAANNQLEYVAIAPSEGGADGMIFDAISTEYVTTTKKFHSIYARNTGTTAQNIDTLRYTPAGGGGALTTNQAWADMNIASIASNFSAGILTNTMA